MFLIVGLGNPGEKYQYSRHNLGFRVVEEIAHNFHCADFSFQKNFNSEIIKTEYNQKTLLIIKPQTFMNKSGLAVKKITNNFPSFEQLIVVHDDLDLPVGKIRISKDRGPAGHKGIISITKELNTKDFIRIRIGIKPTYKRIFNTERFVLKNFNKKEENIIQETIKQSTKIIESLISEGLEKTMNKYNS